MSGAFARTTLAARGVLAASALSATLTVAVALAEGFGPARDLVLVRWSGWIALLALTLSLAMSPIGVLFLGGRGGTIGELRRAFGLQAAAFGALHLALALLTRLAPDVALLVLEPQERAGLGAVVVLLALAGTSFPAVARRTRLWRELHALAYAAALLALHHVALSSMASVRLAAGAGGLVALGLALRVLKGRRAGGR